MQSSESFLKELPSAEPASKAGRAPALVGKRTPQPVARVHRKTLQAAPPDTGLRDAGARDASSQDIDAQDSGPQDSVPATEATAVAAEAISPERIEAVIQEKHIGERIKQLRQRKGMGLVELGRHTGLSASFLSQLETGRVVPTLRNLSRIAMVFSRDISYFLAPKRAGLFRLQRAAERLRLPQTGAAEPDYFFESLGVVPTDRGMVPYIAEFLPLSHDAQGKPVGDRKAHRHQGSELLFVLTGTLEIRHGERVEQCHAADAVYFNSSVPHSYCSVGEQTCTAMILTLPETSSRSRQPAGTPVTAAPVAAERKAAK
jgi:transcriptional regulator with XRE-family HTH domain